MSKLEYVILVDEEDNPIGKEEKMEAHRKALLHRAFSVFLYRVKDGVVEILLQQREKNKYHCPGLWANTCCSHPRIGEDTIFAGLRRLKEETGIHLKTQLRDIGWFQYKATFDNGLTEHEIDHVLIGAFEKDTREIQFNPAEVAALRWMSLSQVKKDLHQHPKLYSPWFPTALALAEQAYFQRLEIN